MAIGIAIGFVLGYIACLYMKNRKFKEKFNKSFKDWLRNLKDKDEKMP